MKLKLLKLTIENFKGQKSFSSSFEDSTLIIGDNGSGKTTIFDAYLWLISGKDSLGQANFSIKTLDPSGAPINKLTHFVEAVFSVDGMTKTFRREYREKWQKKRGEESPEFVGHESSYLVDNVPVTMADYNYALNAIIPDDTWMMLSNPFYFNSMKWEKRRQLILDVAGNVSDAEILEQYPEFASLGETLKLKPLATHKASVKASISRLKKEISDIPSRIDELEQQMPPKIDLAKTEADLALCEKDISELETAMSSKIKGVEQSQKQFNALRQSYWNAKDNVDQFRNNASRTATENNEKVLASLDETYFSLTRQKQSLERTIISTEDQIRVISEDIEGLKSKLEELRGKYVEIKSETYAAPHEEVNCPTCHRPWEDAELRIQVSESSFNAAKIKRLDEVSAKGGEMYELQKRLEKELESTNAFLAEYIIEFTELDASLDKAKKAISDHKLAQVTPIDVTLAKSKEYKTLVVAMEAAETAMKGITVHEADISTERGVVNVLKAQRDMLLKSMTYNDVRESILVRIDTLKEMEKDKNAEMAGLEKEEFLISKFEKTKVEALYDKISEKFPDSDISFTMYKQLINGGEEPACETLINGVPWQDANHGSKINAGISIINTLSKHYDIEAPVWVDNAEAVMSLNKPACQLIALYAMKRALTTINYTGSAELMNVESFVKNKLL
jgi:exonuclease SbcC